MPNEIAKINESQKITVKAPGKLYLAGEYAVVSPNQSALVFAVDAFIELSVFASATREIIDNDGSQYSWELNQSKEVIINGDYENELSLTASAMTVSLNYVAQKLDIDISNLKLTLEISSDLQNSAGKKYGFGSSGAASVATCRSILMLFNIDSLFTQYEFQVLIFKLAALSQMRLEKLGSFGDLAASSLSGMVHYQNFDRSFIVDEKLESSSIKLLAESNWPGLILRSIELPKEWELSIIWSEKASSTEDLLKLKGKEIAESEMRLFLEESNKIIFNLIEAIKTANWSDFSLNLKKNADFISEHLAKQLRPYNLDIFDRAKEIAEAESAIFKISGSGAGDCAIAISPNHDNAMKVRKNWEATGLKVLSHKLWKGI
ncbi:phosphomevalonate kinase [Fastidiosipila sanguinis]|uniref:phosphomevalonate kinase n=1 Tax=Fastidiosipila sanguinis TaxID=236753 RepID=A0A2S0KM53_9FIRM|nr:phosphomevalonate kinase [Fastidiosipila sanguinis]AVM42106.1 phosphomevalonate kinase [Fastidiosipila sanguinis]